MYSGPGPTTFTFSGWHLIKQHMYLLRGSVHLLIVGHVSEGQLLLTPAAQPGGRVKNSKLSEAAAAVGSTESESGEHGEHDAEGNRPSACRPGVQWRRTSVECPVCVHWDPPVQSGCSKSANTIVQTTAKPHQRYFSVVVKVNSLNWVRWCELSAHTHDEFGCPSHRYFRRICRCGALLCWSARAMQFFRCRAAFTRDAAARAQAARCRTATARRFSDRLWRRRRISDRWAYGIWDGQACPKWGGTSPLRCAFLSSNQLKTLCFAHSLGLSACSRLRFYMYERACMCTARRWRKWGSSPVLKTHGQSLRSISPAGRWVLGGEPCVCICVFGCVYTYTWHLCTDLPRTWLS